MEDVEVVWACCSGGTRFLDGVKDLRRCERGERVSKGVKSAELSVQTAGRWVSTVVGDVGELVAEGLCD